MKTIVMSIVLLSIWLAVGCTQTGQSVNKDSAVPQAESGVKKDRVTPQTKLYTAYNIWIVRQLLLRRCINYKHGYNIIPAGTEVRNVKIGSDSDGRDVIKFTRINDNREYNIYFVSRWHPGKTIEDYMGYMFTPNTFEELTAEMTEREIEAIKKGTILNGMSKKAVLVSYGYPPEHRTRSLESNVWTYWRNKLTSFEVCFDQDERTTYCK